MKFTPILYSTAMVCAILDGRKTQTRRIIKPQPTDDWMANTRQFSADGNMFDHRGKQLFWLEKPNFVYDAKSKKDSEIKPYGRPGDILWVREKWRRAYFPIGWPYHFYAANDVYTHPDNEKWKPGIHMPKEATRLFTKIIEVRVERLQDITEVDAAHEGVQYVVNDGRFANIEIDAHIYRNYHLPETHLKEAGLCSARDSYQTLWEVINGPGSWDANPWVWAITNPRYDVPQEDWQAFRADFLKGGAI